MKDSVVLELTSADIPGALLAIGHKGIEVRDVTQTGPLSVRVTVPKGQYDTVADLAQRRGETVRPLARRGLRQRLRGMSRHLFLMAGVIVLLALTLFLPTRVLFIEVEGNSTVETKQILEEAESCGIIFFAKRSEIRSERIKNTLLDAIPQLQWVGVNTCGCVATISVRERSEMPQQQSGGVGSIVAQRDGVVSQITATRGTPRCKVGQAVRAGEVLISGYTDCGLSILAQRAEGEVFAQTSRVLEAVALSQETLRTENSRTETKFALVIGKNRINFYQGSGILDSSCVKMYTEYYMTLPGGLQLPVKLVKETYVYSDSAQAEVQPDVQRQLLSDSAGAYLQGQMNSGRLLQRQEEFSGCVMRGNYVCLEMIGQIQYEEIVQKNGKNDTEDS